MMESNRNQTIQALEALVAVADLVVTAIRECGKLGMPSGILYASLNSHGISLARYEQLMSLIVQAGRVRKSGHVYYAT